MKTALRKLRTTQNLEDLYPLEILHDYSIDPQSREIYISGEPQSAESGSEPGVEFQMAARLIKNLRFLTSTGLDPIIIHLKTCGGYWEEGIAMFDALCMCPCPITILSYTHARSMSSIILQAADYRVLMPNSYFLFHMGTHFTSGTAQEVFSQIDWAKHTMKVMLTIYAAEMQQKGFLKGKSLKVIREFLQDQMDKKTDVFLTPTQAVSYGLADAVFDGNWAKLRKAKHG